ncbi:MAG: hypothetical protein J0J01_29925 [Reyranella sp.]|uniref:hypothetical protein n=1 Tax=Reyranella sp. TaxID=1929291 RepID=UPI001AC1EF55|nr:hypothetical protein [Reyranella sp.]MBN9091156.1 hypothetical protein [Reyranella sp.]
MALDKLEPAVADCTEALRLRPNFTNAFNGRGVARRRAGDGARGDADVARAQQLEPGVAARFRHYGRLDL